MEDFEYYGLFLTEGSKTKLKEWLWLHGYDFNNDIIKGILPENWHLDHCTLIHKRQLVRANWEYVEILNKHIGQSYIIKVVGIGYNNKALAFKVNLSPLYSINTNPHITICTFNGGKPVDSNMITKWKDIESIFIETKLKMKKKR